MTRRILLLGKNGQLGWELHDKLAPLGEVASWEQPELDLKKPGPLREIIRSCHADVIVNAAAYTSVDQAESELETAWAINALAPGVIAEEARKLGSFLIHYSTDYVFDGQSDRPYTEADPPRPVNAYGESKLAGEQAIQAVGGAYLILRASWVYGLRRRSFVGQVLQWAHSQPTMRVVTDQVGSPTWCRALAEATARLIEQDGDQLRQVLAERSGVYHLAGWGSVSRLDWARLILALDPNQERQVVRSIEPALSQDFPLPAKRPQFTALDCRHIERIFGLRLPDWEDSLRLAMRDA